MAYPGIQSSASHSVEFAQSQALRECGRRSGDCCLVQRDYCVCDDALENRDFWVAANWVENVDYSDSPCIPHLAAHLVSQHCQLNYPRYQRMCHLMIFRKLQIVVWSDGRPRRNVGSFWAGIVGLC